MDQQINDLTNLFLKFPGIGERQARRFAYFIVSQPSSYINKLAGTIRASRENSHTCLRCFRVFEGSGNICSICSNPGRDQGLLLVIEKSQDIESFEKTEYNGLFFVLGGLIPVVQKKVLDLLQIKQLEERIKDDLKSSTLREVILAFPLTPNGDHTDEVLRNILTDSISGLKISSLGRGLSTGTELEYADPLSLNASLKKRE